MHVRQPPADFLLRRCFLTNVFLAIRTLDSETVNRERMK